MKNWLQKICTTFEGGSTPRSWGFYMPKEIGEPEAIYQSKDVPWVFLGSADNDDLMRVQKMSGRPVCMRIDLTDQDTSHMPAPSQKIPFPEFPVWTDPAYRDTQVRFNKAVDSVVGVIKNHQCPIYVHCSAGANRSVSVLASALSHITGRSVFDIIKEMKTRRGVVSPHDAYLMMAVDYSKNPEDQKRKEQVRSTMDSNLHPDADYNMAMN